MITESGGMRKRKYPKPTVSRQDRSFMMIDLLSFILSERLMRFLWNGLSADGLLDFGPDLVLLPALHFFLFYLYGLYAYRYYVHVFLSSWQIFKVLTISFILREGVGGILFVPEYGALFSLSLYAAIFSLVLLTRAVFKKIVLNGNLECKIVIIGGEEVKKRLSGELSDENNRNMKVVAEIPTSGEYEEDVKRLEEFLASEPDVRFVVSDPGYLNKPGAAHVFGACMAHRASCVDLVDIIALMEGRILFEFISSSEKFPVLRGRQILSRKQYLCKRALDLVSSVTILVLFAPLGLIIAIAIKFANEGPVFYSQSRVTQYGKLFTAYKFRTMRMEAGRPQGAVVTKEGDPRVFPLGRLLRRYHLDEFPQLWNVIRGDISLVGPRTEYVEATKTAKRLYPEYEYRVIVPAGITGWAQVLQGYVNKVEDCKAKLEYDLYYILNYSFYMDLQVIFLTILTFLRIRGHGT